MTLRALSLRPALPSWKSPVHRWSLLLSLVEDRSSSCNRCNHVEEKGTFYSGDKPREEGKSHSQAACRFGRPCSEQTPSGFRITPSCFSSSKCSSGRGTPRLGPRCPAQGDDVCPLKALPAPRGHGRPASRRGRSFWLSGVRCPVLGCRCAATTVFPRDLTGERGGKRVQTGQRGSGKAPCAQLCRARLALGERRGVLAGPMGGPCFLKSPGHPLPGGDLQLPWAGPALRGGVKPWDDPRLEEVWVCGHEPRQVHSSHPHLSACPAHALSCSRRAICP